VVPHQEFKTLPNSTQADELLGPLHLPESKNPHYCVHLIRLAQACLLTSKQPCSFTVFGKSLHYFYSYTNSKKLFV